MARSVERPRAPSLPSSPASLVDSIRAINPSPVKPARRAAAFALTAPDTSSPSAPHRSPPAYGPLLARQVTGPDSIDARPSRVLQPVRSLSGKLSSSFRRDISALPASPTSDHATCAPSSPLPAVGSFQPTAAASALTTAPITTGDIVRPAGPPLKRFTTHLVASFSRKSRTSPAHALSARTPYKTSSVAEGEDPKTRHMWSRIFRKKKASAAGQRLSSTPDAVPMRKRGRVSTGSARSRITRDEAVVQSPAPELQPGGAAGAAAYYASVSSPRRSAVQVRPAQSSRKKPRRGSLSPASKAKTIHRGRPVARAAGPAGFYSGLRGAGARGRDEPRAVAGVMEGAATCSDTGEEAEWFSENEDEDEDDPDCARGDAVADPFSRSTAPSPSTLRARRRTSSGITGLRRSATLPPVAPLRFSHQPAIHPSTPFARQPSAGSSADFCSPGHRELTASILGMLPSPDDWAAEAFEDAPEPDSDSDSDRDGEGGEYIYATTSARSDEGGRRAAVAGDEDDDLEFVDAKYSVDGELEVGDDKGGTLPPLADEHGRASEEEEEEEEEEKKEERPLGGVHSARPASTTGSVSSAADTDASAQDVASAKVSTALRRVSAASTATAADDDDELEGDDAPPRLGSLSPISPFKPFPMTTTSSSPPLAALPNRALAAAAPPPSSSSSSPCLATLARSGPAFTVPQSPADRAALERSGARVFRPPRGASDDEGEVPPSSVGSGETALAGGWRGDGHGDGDGDGDAENDKGKPRVAGAGSAKERRAKARGQWGRAVLGERQG
ncbi:hypothetical protein JCM3770_006162 [Rhodotorula araucariae]